MSLSSNFLGDLFILSKLFSSDEIVLSAWSKNDQNELIAIYLRNGDFIYYSLTDDPIIKQIPWFSDSRHTPVSIHFSPSGDSLLVLSVSCHLYILPTFSLFESTFREEYFSSRNDLTIITYPFTSKTTKSKVNSKSPNSNIRKLSCSSSSRSSEKEGTSHFNYSALSDFQGNEIIIKFKEILGVNCELFPTVVCWWQSIHNNQQVGIIGTKSGEIIFVDLNTGLKIGETSVKGEIKRLSVCQDDIPDNVFLLITVGNDEQYKLTLEQRHLNYVWSANQKSSGNEDHDSVDTNASGGNGNYAPSARARLQGLKQMSAEKLAMLKSKIAETRSKIAIKQDVIGEMSSSSKLYGPTPKNLNSLIGDTLLFPQYLNEENVLVGYYTHSHLLTVHSMNLDLTPLSVHKMPVGTEEVLVCDRVMYAISNNRTSLLIISSKLSETSLELSTEFNPDSLIEKWDFSVFEQKSRENHQSSEMNEKKTFLAKPDIIPENYSDKIEERILSVYRSTGKYEDYDIGKMYKLDTKKNELPDFPKIEKCIVITNKNVYIIELKSNLIKVVLDVILQAHDLEKAERICTIFGISLQKLFELAGDIKLAALDFTMAIAFYKLSKCGLLKSIVKLACGNHCSQVLNYSTMLMADSISVMSLTERIHLSNIVLMSYSEQILKNENNRNLLEKFLEFLQTNSYFDEVLAVSVTGQSLLFSCLYKLITCKGLILDGYSVLIKLMTRFLKSKILERTLNKIEFWKCVTSVDLVEAIMVKSSSFLIYVDFVSQHLDDLEPTFLERLLKVLDPTAPCIRPISRFFKTSGESFDNDDTQAGFPFAKLVELFLVTLLIKLHKSKNDEVYYRDLIKPIQETSDDGDSFGLLNEAENFGSGETLSDEIWPIRKDIQVVDDKKFIKKAEVCLSCGYGHTALIRNGNVYTWGHTAKGCLGQGPTMSRSATPSPVTWLSCFKLEVSLVSCGKYHTAALTNNGIYTWGCSRYGQLGLGEVYQSPHPRLVSALANENVISLCCGQYHTLALSSQGSVFSWGWGVHGQLGLGSVADQRYPKYVKALKEHVIVDIKAGHGHSLVLSDKGHVYSFGSGIFGQLGTSNTSKKSLPVLVRGFNDKVLCIATGYFHNLALTESNSLYTWGASPQCLRFLAQARKKSRLLQCQNSSVNSSDLDSSKTINENFSEQVSAPEVSRENSESDKMESEEHLSPSLVNTSNVTGKIIQISCGCHHSALVTDSGDLYTWGRSSEGQLGNGSHREISVPTQINVNSFKVDYVSCGCEFTTAQDRHTGKIYSWGSNSVGQLAIPVKESATKSLDGKFVMLRSCKRIVRLLDRSAGSNSVDTPKEVSDIPPPTFTYQTLNKHITSSARNLVFFDQEYSHRSLHFVIETFRHIINLPFVLSKSLECGNYQAASKILILENKCKKSIIYQLKALQSLPKYHSSSYLDEKVSEEENITAEKPFRSLKTTFIEENDCVNPVKSEYVHHAKYILESYIGLNSDQRYEDCNIGTILETGIQFWMAEKLPMTLLEDFLLTKLDELFYDFGFILFCQQDTDVQLNYLKEFSSQFLFTVISKILTCIGENECCPEYLEAMSKILMSNKTFGKKELNKKSRIFKRKKPKSETYLEAVRECLKQQWNSGEFIKVSYGDLVGDNVYFFSCGHYYSSEGLSEEYKMFDEIGDGILRKNLIDFYEILNHKYRGDLACPLCVRHYLRK